MKTKIYIFHFCTTVTETAHGFTLTEPTTHRLMFHAVYHQKRSEAQVTKDFSDFLHDNQNPMENYFVLIYVLIQVSLPDFAYVQNWLLQ